jgi:hypothetical protein
LQQAGAGLILALTAAQAVRTFIGRQSCWHRNCPNSKGSEACRRSICVHLYADENGEFFLKKLAIHSKFKNKGVI